MAISGRLDDQQSIFGPNARAIGLNDIPAVGDFRFSEVEFGRKLQFI
jgi:hypothetical protein